MNMTGHSGFIVAALFAGAIVTTGCSQDSKPTTVKSEKPATVTPQPTPTSYVPETKVAPAPPKAVTFKDGEAAYRAGNYAEATTTFTSLTKEKPGNAWGHYMLGLSASKSGDTKTAMAAFDEALRLDPKHVKSLINSARLLIDQKKPEDALPRLDAALMLEPDSADVQRLFARAYQAQGKFDEAITAYERAIELNDKDAWSHNNLGLLLFDQGRAADAVPQLTRAVELRKDVAVFSNNLGMALEHTGKFQDAAASYKTALEADPSNAKAKKNLARVEHLKDVVQATDVPSKVESDTTKADSQAGLR
jgi:Tfp pilus assembly protein PilF